MASDGIDLLQCRKPEEELEVDEEVYKKARTHFIEMFRVYGTHYISEVTLGGKVMFSKYIKSRHFPKRILLLGLVW